MDIKTALEKLDKIDEKRAGYDYALSLLSWDANTIAPPKAEEGRSRALGLLSGEAFNAFINDETGEILSVLTASSDALSPENKRRVELMNDEYTKNVRIPVDEYVEFSVSRVESESAWKKAKAASDFKGFSPWLVKMVGIMKRFAHYYNPSLHPYDALLGEYEKGLNREICDNFFGNLKEKLVPVIHSVAGAQKVDTSFLSGRFDTGQQAKLADYLMEIILLPKDSCILGETEHPFTIGLSKGDTRITTHFHEDLLTAALYSTMHEGGHALYDMGGNPDYGITAIASPAYMSMHESQSRFLENYIGRSRAFTRFILPKIKELFPQLAEVDGEKFYKAVNESKPSLIRIEADELTYPMHILIRYEIEKALFDGQIDVDDLPGEWNRLYKEYLGVDVPNDAKGVLQDTHWAGGLYGYFPTYALGSAYAAQFFAAMKRDVDVEAAVAKGDLHPVLDWLSERIHRDAGMPTVPQIMLKASREPFNPDYYTNYLTAKFRDIYEL